MAEASGRGRLASVDALAENIYTHPAAYEIGDGSRALVLAQRATSEILHTGITTFAVAAALPGKWVIAERHSTMRIGAEESAACIGLWFLRSVGTIKVFLGSPADSALSGEGRLGKLWGILDQVCSPPANPCIQSGLEDPYLESKIVREVMSAHIPRSIAATFVGDEILKLTRLEDL